MTIAETYKPESNLDLAVKKFNSNAKVKSNSQEKECHEENEYHVASFVGHAMADQLDAVQQTIKSTEGAEIHAVSEHGKIVFTIEDSSQSGIGRKIDSLKYHTGLLNLAPIYHQFLTENQTDK